MCVKPDVLFSARKTAKDHLDHLEFQDSQPWTSEYLGEMDYREKVAPFLWGLVDVTHFSCALFLLPLFPIHASREWVVCSNGHTCFSWRIPPSHWFYSTLYISEGKRFWEQDREVSRKSVPISSTFFHFLLKVDTIPNLVSSVWSQASHRATFCALGEDGWALDREQKEHRGPFPGIIGTSLMMSPDLVLRRRPWLSARSVQSQED